MSLRLRLLAAFAFVLVLVIAALEIPLALNVSRRIESEVKAQAAGEAQVVAASASGVLGDEEALARLARSAAADLGGRVIVVDGDGRLEADSAGGGLRGADYGNRPEIRTAVEDGRTAQGERYSETLEQTVLFTAVPIVVDGRTEGAVRVTQSVEAIEQETRRDILGLIAVGALALVLGLGFAWVLAGSLSRPLVGLSSAARRVAGGDLSARATVEGASEQQEVARSFNEMVGRLGGAYESQREFVANASHQLRTPLTALRLRLEAAALKAGDPAVADELEEAEREVDRLARLLAALLTLARADERRPEATAVDLAECAERAVERWRPQAMRSEHELVLAAEGDAAACASPEDVAIVLDNLIENALTYSPSGHVTVVCGRRDTEAYVAVLDEGLGIPPDEAERVFARFSRGSAGRGKAGTGLGLAIVAALAERWGGAASIATRPEGGARAEVRLPAAALSSASAALQTPDRDLDEALPGAV